MSGFDNMIKIGELADKKMVNEIISGLCLKGIQIAQVYNANSETYELYTKDEASALIAFEYYRVRVGLPAPPREIPEEWKKLQSVPLGKITLTFLLISIFVYLSKVFYNDSIYKLFFITEREYSVLPEILRGEIWRIITPVFLHFNFIHILFNGMWMKDLGSMIEEFKGKPFYIALILTSGILSNLGQYLVKGPFFGGLSGIVYALLGFIWMNKFFDNKAEYSLPKRDVVMMIGWFFVCFTGIFGPIANTAHGLGLGIGMIFGIISGSHSSQKWDIKKISKFITLATIFGMGTLAFEFFIIPMIS